MEASKWSAEAPVVFGISPRVIFRVPLEAGLRAVILVRFGTARTLNSKFGAGETLARLGSGFLFSFKGALTLLRFGMAFETDGFRAAPVMFGVTTLSAVSAPIRLEALVWFGASSARFGAAPVGFGSEAKLDIPAKPVSSSVLSRTLQME